MNQVCGYLQDKGEYDPSKEKTFTPAPVNRLDRNTTGLVVFGKNSAALRNLTRSIREHDNIEKYYMTIVCGSLNEPVFLNENLKRDTDRNISEVSSDGSGKAAATYVEAGQHGKNFSLVEVKDIHRTDAPDKDAPRSCGIPAGRRQQVWRSGV